MSASQLLRSRGWFPAGLTFQHGGNGIEHVTWWRKAGGEFPQHFAVWLERSGWVRTL